MKHAIYMRRNGNMAGCHPFVGRVSMKPEINCQEHSLPKSEQPCMLKYMWRPLKYLRPSI